MSTTSNTSTPLVRHSLDEGGSTSALALTTQLTTLTNENADLLRRLDEATLALANEKAAASAERKGRAAMTADLAIHRGIIPIAQRDQTIDTLTNSRDFDKDAKDLLDQQPTHKTTTNQAARLAVANEMANPRQLFLGEVTKEMAAQKVNFDRAWEAAAKKNPVLYEQMRTAPPLPAA